MKDENRTKAELISELQVLRARTAELEAEQGGIRRPATAEHDGEPTRSNPRTESRRPARDRTAEAAGGRRRAKQEKEQRRRTEEELKRTKEYLENVIENSVDAIGIVDRHGRFILWNRRAAEIYGYDFDELSGKSAFELYADRAELNRMLAQLRGDGVVREYEIRMRKKNGSIVPMDISISLLRDDRGAIIGSVCVARDLSQRKRAEIELTRAKEALSRYSKELERQVRERTREITNIIKYTPAVVYIKDRDGRYRLVNSRYEELFGLKNEQVRGKLDRDLFPEPVADQFRRGDLQVLNSNHPCQVEERIPQDDGVHTYLSVKFPIYDGHGSATGVCGISTDITELKKTQDQLRRLSGSIMAGQEKERAAMARELHDELGQILTALRLDSVWLHERFKESNPKAAARVQAMCDLIDNTIDEVRGMALRLRPGVLDDLGLIAALEWYTADYETRTGIACILEHRDIPMVGDITATAAYRIAQEALTNVARHSAASHVEVTLQAEDGVLALSVVDNGVGFDCSGLAESEGLGLAGMRERAGLAGGTLQIRSRPGKGCRVYCRLPFQNRSGAQS